MVRVGFSTVGSTDLFTAFPRVEALRQKVRAMHFTPATDAELARFRRADAEANAVNALEDIYPPEEETAFFEMMLEERLPLALRASLSQEYVDIVHPK